MGLSTRVLGSGPGPLLLAFPFTPEAATLVSGRAWGLCFGASCWHHSPWPPACGPGMRPWMLPSGLGEGPGAPLSRLDVLLPLFLSPDPGSYSCFRERFGGTAPSISSELNEKLGPRHRLCLRGNSSMLKGRPLAELCFPAGVSAEGSLWARLRPQLSSVPPPACSTPPGRRVPGHSRRCSWCGAVLAFSGVVRRFRGTR